jgi:hypothetical protein
MPSIQPWKVGGYAGEARSSIITMGGVALFFSHYVTITKYIFPRMHVLKPGLLHYTAINIDLQYVWIITHCLFCTCYWFCYDYSLTALRESSVSAELG